MYAFIKKHIILTLFAIFIFVGIVLVVIVTLGGNRGQEEGIRQVVDPNQSPPTTELEVDYNELNTIIPGESTQEDVERISGLPYEISKSGVYTFMYYRTPIEFYENIVALRNDSVLYVLENVYSSYRGEYSDYTDKYGNPSFILYSEDSEWPWHIFLEAGVAIESSNLQDITAILYFIPQSGTSFVVRIAPSLNLVASLEEHIEEFFVDEEFEEFLINEEEFPNEEE